MNKAFESYHDRGAARKALKSGLCTDAVLEAAEEQRKRLQERAEDWYAASQQHVREKS